MIPDGGVSSESVSSASAEAVLSLHYSPEGTSTSTITLDFTSQWLAFTASAFVSWLVVFHFVCTTRSLTVLMLGQAVDIPVAKVPVARKAALQNQAQDRLILVRPLVNAKSECQVYSQVCELVCQQLIFYDIVFTSLKYFWWSKNLHTRQCFVKKKKRYWLHPNFLF